MSKNGTTVDTVIDTIDWQGDRVIFTKKKWKEKAKQHPELNSKTFLRNVVKTIEKPQQVWEDYDNKKDKQCYYWKYSVTNYIKVVIWINDDPCRVVTAYFIDWVKESKYNLKRIK